MSATPDVRYLIFPLPNQGDVTSEAAQDDCHRCRSISVRIIKDGKPETNLHVRTSLVKTQSWIVSSLYTEDHILCSFTLIVLCAIETDMCSGDLITSSEIQYETWQVSKCAAETRAKLDVPRVGGDEFKRVEAHG